MNDMTHVIIPKSDQINADDLLAAPLTITITEVQVKPGQEQPVSIRFDGSDKVYRPCKSMARVLVAAWGPDASRYVGRSLTLYCDPKVKWGGMEVGGIRISHMSHIEAPMTMALTVTRANKKPFTVKPIAARATQAPRREGGTDFEDDAQPESITAEQVAEIERELKLRAITLPTFLAAGKVAKVSDIAPGNFTSAMKWIRKHAIADALATWKGRLEKADDAEALDLLRSEAKELPAESQAEAATLLSARAAEIATR